MLASAVERPDVPQIGKDEFAFVLDQDRTYVILGPVPRAIRDEVTATPKFVSDDDWITARVALPQAPFASLIGRSVQLYSGDKKTCHGQIERVDALARVVPHFATRTEWRGFDQMDERVGPPATKAQIAKHVWELSEMDGAFLVGIFRPSKTASPCDGPEWGRFAAPSASGESVRRPRFAPAVAKPNPSLQTLAEKTFRASREYREIQAEFDREGRAPGPWHLYQDGRLQMNAFGTGKNRFVFVRARSGEGCGDFEGRLWAAYRVQEAAGTGPSLEKVAGDFGNFVPETVLDFDGDDVYEFIGKEVEGLSRSLLEHTSKGYQSTREFHVGFLDCSC
jgi:hypothetical protein